MKITKAARTLQEGEHICPRCEGCGHWVEKHQICGRCMGMGKVSDALLSPAVRLKQAPTLPRADGGAK